jgi:hypothetical protein
MMPDLLVAHPLCMLCQYFDCPRLQDRGTQELKRFEQKMGGHTEHGQEQSQVLSWSMFETYL